MSAGVIIGGVVTFGAFITACTLIWKYVLRPVRAWFSKINRGMDSLLGYGAVTDPGTGEVLQEATPMLSKRVKNVEEAVLKLTEATQVLTDTATRLEAVERQVATLLAWQKDHDALHTIMAETKAAQDHTQVVINAAPAEKTGNT